MKHYIQKIFSTTIIIAIAMTLHSCVSGKTDVAEIYDTEEIQLSELEKDVQPFLDKATDQEQKQQMAAKLAQFIDFLTAHDIQKQSSLHTALNNKDFQKELAEFVKQEEIKLYLLKQSQLQSNAHDGLGTLNKIEDVDVYKLRNVVLQWMNYMKVVSSSQIDGLIPDTNFALVSKDSPEIAGMNNKEIVPDNSDVTISADSLLTENGRVRKYWQYRKRLQEKFLQVGAGPGFSLPAAKRSTKLDVVKWTDSTIFLGWYMGVLATELSMLKSTAYPEYHAGDANRFTKSTRELYYALKALERVDLNANAMFGGSPSLDGFFVRDDVPQGFQQKLGTTNLTSDFVEQPATNKEVSQDQIIGLLLGLRMIEHYLSADVQYNGVSLVGLAKQATHRMISKLHRDNWIIQNPESNKSVARGENAIGFAVPFSKIGNIISGSSLDYSSNIPVISSALWESMGQSINPVHMNPDNTKMSMILAALSNGWGNSTKTNLQSLAKLYDYQLYVIVHALLYNNLVSEEELSNNYSKIRAMLDSAPANGPACPENSLLVTHNWVSANRFIRDNQGTGESGCDFTQYEYNGLDYMFLTNLYYLSKPAEYKVVEVPAPVRILVLGDSWAEYTYKYLIGEGRPLQEVLNENKTEVLAVGKYTALGGTRSYNWITDDSMKLVRDQLIQNPEIDIVHLSLGGNDFLEKVVLNQAVDYGLIKKNLRIVINNILTVRPEIKILLNGYTKLDTQPFFLGTVKDLNNLLWFLELGKAEIASEFPNVYFQPYFYMDVPEYTSDGFHLSYEGYKKMANIAYNNFYKYWLKNEKLPLEVISQWNGEIPLYHDIPGKRILYVGDSWSEHMWSFWGSLSDALAEKGLSRFTTEAGGSGLRAGKLGGATDLIGGTAITGSTASMWANMTELQNRIIYQLTVNPTIDIVHLSLGGNDVLMPFEGQIITDEKFHNEIVANIKIVMDKILAFRPNIKIAINGYSYLKKEFPGYPLASTKQELNNNVIYPLEKKKYELAKSYNSERVRYIDNLGLFQNPPEVLMADAIHHNNHGFDIIGRNAVERVYKYWVNGDEAPPIPQFSEPTEPNSIPKITGYSIVETTYDNGGTQVKITVDYHDADGDNMTIFYYDFENGFIEKLDNKTFKFNSATQTAGYGSFKVVVNDGKNTSEPAVISVNWDSIPNIPPTWIGYTVVSKTINRFDVKIRVKLDYFDQDADKITIFHDTGTNGLVKKIDDHNFEFTHADINGIKNGSGSFQVLLNDGKVSTPQYQVSFDWPAYVNHAPTISAQYMGSRGEGDFWAGTFRIVHSYRLNAFDVEGDSLGFGIDSMANGIGSISGNNIEFRVWGYGPGSGSFRGIVWDQVGNVSTTNVAVNW